MPLPTLAPGDLFAGALRITRSISGGEMPVYAAERVATGEAVALQLVEVHEEADARSVVDAAQRARRLAGDHVVSILDTGVEDGVPWIVTELLDGEDLGALLARRGPLDEVEGRALLVAITTALADAHEAGVVHTDLRPEKIFRVRGRDGEPPRVKLLGLGVAARIEAVAPALMRVQHGPASYWRALSPERAEGKWDGGPAADVWALGILAFQMFTAKSYQKGETALELVPEILYDPLPTASARALDLSVALPLPAFFDAWFARCVTRDTASRFADARSAADALGVPRAIRPSPEPVILANPKSSMYDEGLPWNLEYMVREAAEREGRGGHRKPPITPRVPRPEREREIVGNPKGSLYDRGPDRPRPRLALVALVLLALVATLVVYLVTRR